jgi:photosystem II stability/assembly factor-like uncharacterized protein
MTRSVRYASPRRTIPLVVLAIASCAVASRSLRPSAQPIPSRIQQASGTSALLQAVSAASDRVVWVGGHEGTYVRTTDGGRTWHAATVSGADSLQFRDVHAVDSSTAYLLSAGPGDLSRIYKTVDAGRTWTLQFRNRDPRAFFNCMDFWDAQHGIAFSDAIDGEFPVITTDDGGATWRHVSAVALPAALPTETGFAASGLCLSARPPRHAWIGTGNSDQTRTLQTADGGRSWLAVPTPLVSGEGAGITALAFRDTLRGVALGGRVHAEEERGNNVATTSDGGRTWRLAAPPPFLGPVYGGVYVPGAPSPTLVAVGPRGAAYSLDDAGSWAQLDTLSYWSVDFATPSAGWAVGPGGRITRFSLF